MVYPLTTLGLSFICSLGLLISTIARVKSLRGDKYLGIVNTIVLAAILIYNTIKSGADPEPWLNNTLEYTTKTNPGWMPYCSAFNSSVNMGSNLFLRCWLINGLWIATILSCVAWVGLGIFAWTQHTSDVFDKGDGYHYKSDVPLVPVQSPGDSYNHPQGYSHDDPYERSLTASPAAKAAVTYAYNGKPTYEGYTQPSTPTYQDYNSQKRATPGQAYGNNYDRNDGYYDNYVPYRHQDNISPGVQTQSSKYQEDDTDDYYSNPVPDPVSSGRYPSPQTPNRYGGNSPGYQNAYSGYNTSAYDYRGNGNSSKNNYDGR
ncbi:hypothetical protein Unana1_01700 [Umbelopsis nana]